MLIPVVAMGKYKQGYESNYAHANDLILVDIHEKNLHFALPSTATLMHVCMLHKVFVSRKIGIGVALAMPLAMRPWHPCRKWTLLIITIFDVRN